MQALELFSLLLWILQMHVVLYPVLHRLSLSPNTSVVCLSMASSLQAFVYIGEV